MSGWLWSKNPIICWDWREKRGVRHGGAAVWKNKSWRPRLLVNSDILCGHLAMAPSQVEDSARPLDLERSAGRNKMDENSLKVFFKKCLKGPRTASAKTGCEVDPQKVEISCLRKTCMTYKTTVYESLVRDIPEICQTMPAIPSLLAAHYNYILRSFCWRHSIASGHRKKWSQN